MYRRADKSKCAHLRRCDSSDPWTGLLGRRYRPSSWVRRPPPGSLRATGRKRFATVTRAHGGRFPGPALLDPYEVRKALRVSSPRNR